MNIVKENLRLLPSFSIPILSKTILALAGFANLVLSINLLSPNDFTELAIIQTLTFVLVTIFDTGFTQNSLYKIVNDIEWKKKSIIYQGNRLSIFLVISVFFIAYLTLQQKFNVLLLVAALCSVFVNLLNVDWILIGLQDKKNLAFKNIVFGLSSVLFTFFLVKISNTAESVLFATTLATIVAYIFFCRVKRFPVFFRLVLPKASDLKPTMHLSLANTSTHLSYNLPILLISYFGQSNITNVFACLYRLFSSSILFVAPVIEFNIASELSKEKKSNKVDAGGIFYVFLKFSLTSLLLCSPFLVLPNQFLFDLFLKFFDLRKYNIDVSNLIFLRVLVFFFCLEYSLIKCFYVYKMKSIISISTLLGMLSSIGYIVFSFSCCLSLSVLFFIIYVYQLVTLFTGLLYIKFYAK